MIHISETVSDSSCYRGTVANVPYKKGNTMWWFFGGVVLLGIVFTAMMIRGEMGARHRSAGSLSAGRRKEPLVPGKSYDRDADPTAHGPASPSTPSSWRSSSDPGGSFDL